MGLSLYLHVKSLHAVELAGIEHKRYVQNMLYLQDLGKIFRFIGSSHKLDTERIITICLMKRICY
ncbi:MAG: hypothetical protein DRP60_13795 [Spirochaetes bacterium]|nr:MAG: hypothetical protein DRP60_13795 [Spirochaetota bacterium]